MAALALCMCCKASAGFYGLAPKQPAGHHGLQRVDNSRSRVLAHFSAIAQVWRLCVPGRASCASSPQPLVRSFLRTVLTTHEDLAVFQ